MAATYYSFDSFNELIDFLDQSPASTQPYLDKRQLEIAGGVHWVRFVIPEQQMIFGRVETVQEFVAGETKAGATDAELLYELSKLRDNANKGLLLSEMYSQADPRGHLDYVHRSYLWPITPQQFYEARKVGWAPTRIRGLQTWIKDAYLDYQRAVNRQHRRRNN